VSRTYLFVPPEEKAEVEALGAHWDATSMCWYISADEDPARFSKWLPDDASEEEDEEFRITSSQAYVASATVPCEKCHSKIEVICIHCESGTVSGDPLTQFTVSDVWAMDDALVRQLEPWPAFRKVASPDFQESDFFNHCPRCGALQDDFYLHSEPGDPFFSIPRAAPGSIKLTPLVGRIQLSGDEHFEIC
jgi:hypothetical protein